MIMLRILAAAIACMAGLAVSPSRAEACDGVLSQECLLRLGAGALAPQDGCSEELARYRACVADQVLAEERSKTKRVLDSLISYDALDTTRDFLEARVGPPKTSRGPTSYNTRVYDIDGCEATVIFIEGSASSIELALAEGCAYGVCDIAFIADKAPDHCDSGAIQGFGDFAKAFAGEAFQLYGCLAGCGNAVTPELGFRDQGGRYNQFTNFAIGVYRDEDPEFDASERLRDRLRAMGAEGAHLDMGALCELNPLPAIAESFSDVPFDYVVLDRDDTVTGCYARLP
ncbi:MAG: hypothetical protein AAGM38_13765 [Pseudomonadota bacterium]